MTGLWKQVPTNNDLNYVALNEEGIQEMLSTFTQIYDKLSDEKKIQIQQDMEKSNELYNKTYYTPKLEELYIGYECEIQSSYGWKLGTWPNVLKKDSVSGMTSNSIEGILNNSRWLRTKYLTAEEIRAEGWLDNDEQGIGKDTFFFKNGYRLEFKTNYYTTITPSHNREMGPVLAGITKSINEFKKLTEQLNL